jgi:5-methyltetrahydropteroyltriglutamate--homocysteine methyltransferase
MKTNILGYPRIGSHRELKKACENYWAGKISEEQLLKEGASIRAQNWCLQKEYKTDSYLPTTFRSTIRYLI